MPDTPDKPGTPDPSAAQPDSPPAIASNAPASAASIRIEGLPTPKPEPEPEPGSVAVSDAPTLPTEPASRTSGVAAAEDSVDHETPRTREQIEAALRAALDGVDVADLLSASELVKALCRLDAQLARQEREALDGRLYVNIQTRVGEERIGLSSPDGPSSQQLQEALGALYGELEQMLAGFRAQVPMQIVEAFGYGLFQLVSSVPALSQLDLREDILGHSACQKAQERLSAAVTAYVDKRRSYDGAQRAFYLDPHGKEKPTPYDPEAEFNSLMASLQRELDGMKSLLVEKGAQELFDRAAKKAEEERRVEQETDLRQQVAVTFAAALDAVAPLIKELALGGTESSRRILTDGAVREALSKKEGPFLVSVLASLSLKMTGETGNGLLERARGQLSSFPLISAEDVAVDAMKGVAALGASIESARVEPTVRQGMEGRFREKMGMAVQLYRASLLKRVWKYLDSIGPELSAAFDSLIPSLITGSEDRADINLGVAAFVHFILSGFEQVQRQVEDALAAAQAEQQRAPAAGVAAGLDVRADVELVSDELRRLQRIVADLARRVVDLEERRSAKVVSEFDGSDISLGEPEEGLGIGHAAGVEERKGRTMQRRVPRRHWGRWIGGGAGVVVAASCAGVALKGCPHLSAWWDSTSVEEQGQKKSGGTPIGGGAAETPSTEVVHNLETCPWKVLPNVVSDALTGDKVDENIWLVELAVALERSVLELEQGSLAIVCGTNGKPVTARTSVPPSIDLTSGFWENNALKGIKPRDFKALPDGHNTYDECKSRQGEILGVPLELE